MRLLRLLALVLFPVLAAAQGYPNKPVKLIIPFPAGGPSDIFGRGLAQGMAAHFGQPVVVENISGVGGVLGVDRALKSPADGYTLALNSGSANGSPMMGSTGPADAATDIFIRNLAAEVGPGGVRRAVEQN